MRLATLNLKHGATGDEYRGNPEKTAEACASLGADILALQEVDVGVIRSKRADLASLAAEAAGMKVIFARTQRFVVGEYGNALLVRDDIGDIEDYEILKLGGAPRFNFQVGFHKFHYGYEPRNAILATVRIGNQRVSVAAPHLSSQREKSKQQLLKVRNGLLARPSPHVLMGDLNLSAEQVQAALAPYSMELADTSPTYPADDPTQCIDHVAVEGLTICATQVKKLAISDHLARVVDVELQ